jgi:hypothetical protein
MEIISLTLSILALTTSIFFAFRQIVVSKQSNILPVLIDLFQEFRSTEFKKHMIYIMTELNKEHDPAKTGYRYLPEPAAKHVQPVSHFFDNLGILIASKAIDEKLIISFVGESAESAWSILEPYIQQERDIRKGEYQEYFEHLISRIRANPPTEVRRKLRLQKLKYEDQPFNLLSAKKTATLKGKDS